MTTLNLNSDRLIRLPVVDTKANYLAGFWQWVELMAADDYQGALEALYWPRGTSWTPEKLKERVTTFFGGVSPWSVVVPNDRLVGVINDAATFDIRNRMGWEWLVTTYLPRRFLRQFSGWSPAWFMAQVPVSTEPGDPKNDEIPLQGLASSFYVWKLKGHYVLEFEIFHL